MSDEVAVFIDLENLRYGLLNNYGQEPDFGQLVNKAKKYGRPSMMRAYADFSEHPQPLNRQLQVLGIEAINIPVKRTQYTKTTGITERVKNAADMTLALDAIIEALEADNSNEKKIFLIVAGDRDYIKLVTLLRNKFGQRVIICGVPGCISSDLEMAAGEKDPIDIISPKPVDRFQLKSALVSMIKKGPSPLIYWTRITIDQWAQDSRQAIPGTAKDRRDTIGQLLEEKVLVTRLRNDPKRGEVNEIILDESVAKAKGYLT